MSLPGYRPARVRQLSTGVWNAELLFKRGWQKFVQGETAASARERCQIELARRGLCCRFQADIPHQSFTTTQETGS